MKKRRELYYQGAWILLILVGLIFFRVKYIESIITFGWLFMILYNAHRKEDLTNALSVQNSRAIRGIAAIEIMLGHIGIATGSLVQFPNRKAGILFVGLFFMISGYGISYGFDKKQNYLHGFLHKHLLKLLCPVFVLIVVDCMILRTIHISILFDHARWFVWELVLLYLLFWVIYKIMPRYGLVLMTIAAIVIIFTACLLKLTNPWYGSTLCFPLGMAYYKITSEDRVLFRKNRGLCFFLLVAVLLIAVAGFFFRGDTFVGNVIARNVASIVFCLVVLLILEKYTIGNAWSLKLADISYEIYLIHPTVIYVLMYVMKVNNVYLFTVLTMTVTVVLAYIWNVLRNFRLK